MKTFIYVMGVLSIPVLIALAVCIWAAYLKSKERLKELTREEMVDFFEEAK